MKKSLGFGLITNEQFINDERTECAMDGAPAGRKLTNVLRNWRYDLTIVYEKTDYV